MDITRRRVALGRAAATVLARPALAQSEPIRIGWLASLTSPLGAPASGFARGMKWAVDQLNAAGGSPPRRSWRGSTCRTFTRAW